MMKFNRCQICEKREKVFWAFHTGGEQIIINLCRECREAIFKFIEGRRKKK
jgi:hypothetical protein